jgi:hypothetical protein
MQTILVELVNENALRILKDLEVAKIIRLVEKQKNKVKLSERFSGCISKEQADQYQKELIQMREEWERDI